MKIGKILMICMINFLIVAGCKSDKKINFKKNVLVADQKSEKKKNSSQVIWKKKYAEFIKGYEKDSDYIYYSFSLRNLDKDGIPELIIISGQYDGGGMLAVYSYKKENIYQMGVYSDSKLGVSGLRVSENPKFPGLFNCWWGGGVEHYGYLEVINNKLMYQDLWYDNHSPMGDGNWPMTREISCDKELMKESMELNSSSEDKSLLESYSMP